MLSTAPGVFLPRLPPGHLRRCQSRRTPRISAPQPFPLCPRPVPSLLSPRRPFKVASRRATRRFGGRAAIHPPSSFPPGTQSCGRCRHPLSLPAAGRHPRPSPPPPAWRRRPPAGSRSTLPPRYAPAARGGGRVGVPSPPSHLPPTGPGPPGAAWPQRQAGNSSTALLL